MHMYQSNGGLDIGSFIVPIIDQSTFEMDMYLSE